MQRYFIGLVLLISGCCLGNAASKAWTGVVSTSWSNASNWAPSGVPVNGDDVTISAVAIRMPNYSSGTVSLNSLTVSGTLTISGGQITVATNSTMTNLNLSGGTLTGNVNFTINDTFNWTGGTLSGTGTFTISSSAVCNISSANTKTLNARTLTNLGEINWSGTGNLQAVNNPTLNNGIAGVINIQSAADWVGGGTINNQALITQNQQLRGHIVKSGTSITTIGASVNNNGQITVLSGVSLSFDAGGIGGSNSIFNCAGTLNFPLGTVFTFNTGSLVQGTGQINVSGGTVNCNGTYNLTTPNTSPAAIVLGGGALNFNPNATLQSLGSWIRVAGGTLDLNSGEAPIVQKFELLSGSLLGSDRLIVMNEMLWSGGQIAGSGVLELRPTCQTSLSGAAVKQLGGTRAIDNSSDILWTGSGNVQCSGSPVFNNMPNADITIQTGADWTGSGVFNNSGNLIEGQFGKVIKMYSATGEETEFAVQFNNDGRVEIQQSAVLRMSGGGVHNGAFLINSALSLNGGTTTFNSGSLVNGDGQVKLTIGTVHFNGTYNLTPTSPLASTVVSSGTFNFNPSANLQSIGHFALVGIGGTLNLSSGETVTLDDLDLLGGTITGSDVVHVNGAFNWTGGSIAGSGAFRLLQNCLFTIGGVLSKQIQGTRFLQTYGTCVWGGTGNIIADATASFGNFGTFNMTSNAEWIGGRIDNTAQINYTSSDEKQINAQVFNTGSIRIPDSGSILRLTGSFSQSDANATLFVGKGAQLATNTTLNINFGSLSSGNGTAIITGNISVAQSRLVPGTQEVSGKIQLEGNYTQTQNGEMIIDLGGVNNLPNNLQFDQIIVPGNNRTVSLRGKITLNHMGAYQPSLCDEVIIIELTGDTQTQVNGTFDEEEVIGFDPFLVMPKVIYEPKKVKIRMIPKRLGDVDADGCVNDEDLLEVLFNFGRTSDFPCGIDIIIDGRIDDEDLLEVLFNFGLGC
ncbi:MAG: hypothetical protein KIT45_05670 [Fimbriimonadia bacterium]|nr:hypothetical protein [Fimbriimonadia bacterium]